MGTQYRNSFNAGVIDPLLYSRPDSRKWKSALFQGENVILLPQGGCRRRPGTKKVGLIASSDGTRLRAFKVGAVVQYLIVLYPSKLEIWGTNDSLLTTLATPYTGTQIQELGFADEADTMVILHEDQVPRRLLRSTLSSVSIGSPAATRGPLETTNASDVVLVRHADHGLVTGDAVALSGAAATGGIAAADLNRDLEVTTIGGDIADNGVACVQGSYTVTVTTTAAHSLVVGERVKLSSLTALFREAVPAEDLNRKQTITAVPSSTKFSFVVPTKASTTAASGGGTVGAWSAIDKYTVVAGAAATSTVLDGGGSSVLLWSLSSLATDATKKIAFTNLPKFDYKDSLSPSPASESQRLIFSAFGDGDVFRMTVNGIRSNKIEYQESDTAAFAALLETQINLLARKEGIKVDAEGEFVIDGTSEYRYLVRFEGDAAQRNWDTITVSVNSSVDGIFTSESVSEGGSTAEFAMSETRGWARDAAFHQQRFWMVAPKSRPITIMGSVTGDPFNFETGDSQPNDAIDTTAEADPIRWVVVASTGMHLLTIGSVLTAKPDRDSGGYTPPMAFDPGDNFGCADVAPVVMAGRVCYVDRIERSIRQIRASPTTDKLESAEISLYSAHLFNGPVRLEQHRSNDGDYLYVVNGDGTMAVLCLDVPQQVQGWTRFTTTGGSYVDVAEVGGFVYAAVDRTNGRFLEKFDPAFFTDCALQASGTDTSDWTGFDHLDGQTCAVRGDENTLDQVVPGVDTAGAVTSAVAGFPFPCDDLEVGLPYAIIVEPTSPAIGRRTRLISATLDLFESREVVVNGYPLALNSVPIQQPTPLFSGFVRVPCRGWGTNKSVIITQTAPQPFTLRGVEMEGA